MPKRDYYEILGIPRNAAVDQIKRAYRKLAKQYHPDHNPDDPSAVEHFKEVQEAYEILSNPQKRKAYDQWGHAGLGTEGAEPHSGWRSGPAGQRVYTWKSGGGPDIPIDDLDDLFNVFAGHAGGRRRDRGPDIFNEFFQQHGTHGRVGKAESSDLDITYPLNLEFEQALQGTTVEISLDKRGTIQVKIPPGVFNGQRIRVRGKGRTGRRGQTGDLYIVCQVREHPYYRRVDNDLYLELPLSLTEAALGTKVDIPTPQGRTLLTVPPGTPSGARLRLKERGVRTTGPKSPGDLYAVVRIVPPKSLNAKQKELLEQFRLAGENLPRQDLGW
ncbi:MAG: J domain-containing protein [Phycisphaerales bacterium]|nr:J domain-containing protein [Phycisphaerales bacterium]